MQTNPRSKRQYEEYIPYAERLKDARWQLKRNEICSAAGWRCEDCGRCAGDLASSRDLFECHHTVYIFRRAPWDYPNELLMCLCSRCHEWRQQREESARIGLAKILRFHKPNDLQEAAFEIIRQATVKWTEKQAEAFS